MRTESFRRGLGSILLVSVIVFSMTLSMTCVAPPVLADAVISYPGHQLQPQNIFDVPQGHTFTLRHRLAWDEPSESGYCMVVIYWDYFGGNAYHFTLEGAVAYFDDDGDNLPDPGVAMIDNTVQTRDNGTMYVIGMSNTAGDWRDGEFNVDITLRASGPDGTPHAATDNHPIYYAIVQSLESVPPSTAVPLVTVRVLGRGIAVSISPGYQGGEPGATLSYAVTVKNTGIVEDNYDLIVTDSVGWGPSLSENRFENVAPGEDRVATLSVIIPSDALSGMEDSMTVTAISQSDPTVSDFGSCVAQVLGPSVAVSISPSYKSGPPGATLGYTVTITNTGTIDDTYELTISDDENWRLSLSENWFENVAPDEKRTATLSVTVPENAVPSTEDNIKITATSQADPSVSDFDTCIAHAEEVRRGVEVSISPSYQSAPAGTTLSYTVSVRNTGNIEDNYSLSVNDNAVPSWGPSLSENRFENVAPGEDRVATLSVIIPSDALSGMEDSMTVTAISQSDPTVSDFGSCMARSVIPIPSPIPLGVTVSISPGLQSGVPMETLTYTVTVANTRIVGVTYDLVASDNAGWNPTVSPTSLTIAPGESATATLSVTIPDDASSGAEDKITTTITSRTDPTWSDSATCIAHAIVPEVQRWDALITATFSGGSDDALFGVRSNATDNFDYVYDIPEPPAPPEPPYVRAYFYPGQIPDELHRSCLAPENLMEWPLRIEYAEGLEDITLTWNVEDVPADYSVFLYRGENLVADMMAEDSYTFEASAGSYDFRIVVGRIVPFTLELNQGWNMISFPVLPRNTSPDSIFEGYYALYRWDAENKRYVLHADSGGFIEPDPDVDVGVGYWAYVLEDENVDSLGVPVDQLNLSLRQGWNLIGPPYGGSSIADPADDPDDSVLTWAFTWNAREKSYSMTQLLEAGKGYWAYALRDCTLELPSLFQPPQPGYPAIGATSAKHGDNEIRINVVAGSLPAGEWAYSVSSTEGSYSWIQGTEELDAPYVSLGTYASGTYYVSLKHINSGHLYFYDQTITIS